jgi:hypothetical protein
VVRSAPITCSTCTKVAESRAAGRGILNSFAKRLLGCELYELEEQQASLISPGECQSMMGELTPVEVVRAPIFQAAVQRQRQLAVHTALRVSGELRMPPNGKFYLEIALGSQLVKETRSSSLKSGACNDDYCRFFQPAWGATDRSYNFSYLPSWRN